VVNGTAVVFIRSFPHSLLSRFGRRSWCTSLT
jgi:hypothetical protein